MNRRSATEKMILCGLFAALTAAGAFLKIPVPYVPFTLQFLFTTLAGFLLGARWGAASVGAYLALGLAGVPVFAEGGGLSYIFRPTFGYLIGFALGAFVTGTVAGNRFRPGMRRLLLAAFAGLGTVYLCGVVYFYIMANYGVYFASVGPGNGPVSLWAVFLYGFLLAVPGDAALCFLSAAAARRMIPVLNRGAAGRGTGLPAQAKKTDDRLIGPEREALTEAAAEGNAVPAGREKGKRKESR